MALRLPSHMQYGSEFNGRNRKDGINSQSGRESDDRGHFGVWYRVISG